MCDRSQMGSARASGSEQTDTTEKAIVYTLKVRGGERSG